MVAGLEALSPEDLKQRVRHGDQEARIAAEHESLRRFLLGDKAVQRLMIAYLGPALSAAAGPLPPTEQADLVQQIWHHLLKNGCHALRAWDPTRGTTLQGWVNRIAINQRNTWLSARQRAVPTVPLPTDPSLLGADAEPTPEALVAGAGGRTHLLAQARGWFPRTPYATAVVAFLFDGLEPKEIAELLHLPAGTVTGFISRLRDHLRNDEARP